MYKGKDLMNQKEITSKELRQFSFLVGGVFSIIGLWPLIFRGDTPHFWVLAIGGGLIFLGLVLPRSLAPVYRGWMVIGHALGWINTRIILGLVFYGMITPMGMAMRLLGKDPLHRRFSGEAESYRVNRTPRERTHMRNLF
jgi:hypothetical protein